MRRVSEEKDLPEPLPTSEQRLDIVVPSEPLSAAEQHRLAVIQRLQSYKGKSDYSREQAAAATELGISVRSLRRLQRRYQEAGNIKRQGRSDDSHFRVNESWQAFIVKAYKEGNRGQCQTSRAQVAKLVASHAAEQGDRDYPSREL